MVSEITTDDVALYLKLDDGDYNENELEVIITASKAFVKSYTGLDDDGMDLHDDIVIAIYILCQDMYDNRSLYVDKNNMNKVIDIILGMHSTNLLPSESDTV